MRWRNLNSRFWSDKVKLFRWLCSRSTELVQILGKLEIFKCLWSDIELLCDDFLMLWTFLGIPELMKKLKTNSFGRNETKWKQRVTIFWNVYKFWKPLIEFWRSTKIFESLKKRYGDVFWSFCRTLEIFWNFKPSLIDEKVVNIWIKKILGTTEQFFLGRKFQNSQKLISRIWTIFRNIDDAPHFGNQ